MEHPMPPLTRRLPWTTLLAAGLALGLTGCLGQPITGTPAPDTTAPETSAPAADDTTGPAEQVDSCEWEKPGTSSDATLPSGHVGELAAVLIGSWQHTHYDSGDGMEQVDNDIRYVFPAPGELIYCQHVPGVTDHAESRAAFTLDGSLISPPSPHKGFEVTAWSADRMAWTNNLDGSTYLLIRR
jgi:hypothetical protein